MSVPKICFVLCLGCALVSADETRPNIVLILADDLGYGDLSVNNSDSKIQTPHLDRLATQGRNFTDAHSPSGVCTPTRYGVLTGRYAWRSRLKKGVLNAASPPLIEEGRLTLPAMLVQKGYATGAFGKWHLGREWPLVEDGKGVVPTNIDWSKPALYCALDAGFTYYFGLSKPAWGFMEDRRALTKPTEAFDLSHIPSHIIGGNNDTGYREPGFTFEQMLPAWVEKTNAYIRRQSEADTPFFVYFAPICPHRPINPNKEFQGKSDCGVYGDFVMELDAAVGSLLQTLEETGEADNTLVIFSADNGAEVNTYLHIETYDHWSSNGLRGCKRDLYEGGHRVPFIVRWPGRIPAGTRSDEILCLTDLMATVASIVDYDLPKTGAAEDSYNQFPAFLGESLDSPIREATVHHSAQGAFAIRQGDWVYIDRNTGADNREPNHVLKSLGVQADEEEYELYNLREDPKQTTNAIREYPEKAAALKTLLEDYKNRGSSLPGRS